MVDLLNTKRVNKIDRDGVMHAGAYSVSKFSQIRSFNNTNGHNELVTNDPRPL